MIELFVSNFSYFNFTSTDPGVDKYIMLKIINAYFPINFVWGPCRIEDRRPPKTDWSLAEPLLAVIVLSKTDYDQQRYGLRPDFSRSSVFNSTNGESQTGKIKSLKAIN
jgi:hypothetical protein